MRRAQPKTFAERTAATGSHARGAAKTDGQPATVQGMPGRLFDAQDYVCRRFGLKPGDTLRLFHQSHTRWGQPGERVTIDVKPSPGSAFGDGLYLGRQAVEPLMYGKYQLQLEVPVSALKGQVLFEAERALPRPPKGQPATEADLRRAAEAIEGLPVADADLVVPKGGELGKEWVIFRPRSTEWLNSAAITADFDGDGDSLEWD